MNFSLTANEDEDRALGQTLVNFADFCVRRLHVIVGRSLLKVNCNFELARIDAKQLRQRGGKKSETKSNAKRQTRQRNRLVLHEICYAQCRRHYNQLERKAGFCALNAYSRKQANEHVAVHRTFVRFVDYEHRELAQFDVRLKLLEQNAVCHEQNSRFFGSIVFKANLNGAKKMQMRIFNDESAYLIRRKLGRV